MNKNRIESEVNELEDRLEFAAWVGGDGGEGGSGSGDGSGGDGGDGGDGTIGIDIDTGGGGQN